MRQWVKEPVAYRYEYADGLKATMLLMNGLVGDFTVAARIKGQAEPLSTLFYLPPNPNVTYSAGLMARAEELFTTGQGPVPDRADPADHRAGRGRDAVPGRRAKAAGDAAPGDPIPGAEGIAVSAGLKSPPAIESITG